MPQLRRGRENHSMNFMSSDFLVETYKNDLELKVPVYRGVTQSAPQTRAQAMSTDGCDLGGYLDQRPA